MGRLGWVAVALAAALVGLAVAHLLVDTGAPPTDDALRNEVIAAGKTQGINFTEVDYRHVDDYLTRMIDNCAPTFVDNCRKVSPQLRQAYTSNKVVITSAVLEAAARPANPTRANPGTWVVLVALDEQWTTAKQTTPYLVRQRMSISLVRQPDGRWLVSDIDPNS